MSNVSLVKSAVAQIEEIEAGRIDWESHGWSAEDKCFVVANTSHRMEISSAKENALRFPSSELADWKSKIDFAFLTAEDDTIPDWLSTIWYISFPIDARTSRNVVQTAMRVPKDNVERLFYPLAPIEGAKKKFFDMLVGYGCSFGLKVVGDELLAGARSGDPRAVKMYLEMMKVLDVGGPREDLVRVEFEF